MRKIFFLLFTAILLTACDKGSDAPSSITGYNPGQLNQTLYADQTGSGSGFTFTAAAPWTTQIVDLTPAGRAEVGSAVWAAVSPSQGGAGTFTLTITLSPNLTGADRKAEIRIVCGGTTITITVEQKGTTAGEDPGPDPATAKVITRINSFTDGVADGHITFEYDAQGRTKQFCIYDKAGVMEFKETMTYTEGTIKIETFSKDGDYSNVETSEYTLDASGRVVFREETIDGKKIRMDYTYDAEGYLTDYYSGSWNETEVVPNPVGRADNAGPRPIMNHAVWENGNMKTLYDDWRNGTYENKTEYEYTNYKNGFATIDMTMGATNAELLTLKIGTFGKIRKNLIDKEIVTSKYPFAAGVHNWSYKFDKDNCVTEFTRAFTAADSNSRHNYTETYEIIYK